MLFVGNYQESHSSSMYILFEMLPKWRHYILPAIIFVSVIYAEIVADFIQLLRCRWPKTTEGNELRAMILADTHILGPIRGHWLDKFYREWHMHRAFQAVNFLFQPEIIFILGDLFDEGDMITHENFIEHVQRFQRHFSVNCYTKVISVVGNHDVGFHYRLHPYYTERFHKHYNNTGVHLYSFNGVHFVVINSMAMENDGCYFCENALYDLNEISSKLECLKDDNCENKNSLKEIHGEYSQPILMQHFPTYRQSDEECSESDTSPHMEEYRENWEVLSKSSTDLLGQLLNPRLAFAGHSHRYCRSRNRLDIEEYTVASFNWRNNINPSFLLATFSTEKYAVHKCDMLPQDKVYNVYTLALIITVIWLAIWLTRMMREKTKSQ